MVHIQISGDLELGSKIHEALAGSPAYINSEIILNIDRTPTENIIDLYLGNHNDNDLTIKTK